MRERSRRQFCRAAILSGGAVLAGGLGTGTAAAADAVVTRQEWLSPRLLELTVSSPSMGRTLTNRLLVPPGWSATARRTWPVLYLMHGGNDDYTSWTRMTDVEALSAGSDVLVVMPECGGYGGFTDWWYGGAGGAPAWETYHLTEIRRLMEREYRGSRARVVAGLSGGGYGALIYSARHPGMFRFAACYSPMAATLLPGEPAGIMAGLSQHHVNPFDMWGNPWLEPNVWKEHDPITQAPRLRGLPLYVSCGRTGIPGPLDPAGAKVDSAEILAWYTTRAFLQRLGELRIPVTTHLYDLGTHSWPYWQQELHTTWPRLMRALQG
ncbi:alpha/beta hydrolase [Actinomadura scrupuli]|uniref:alpha/beta hydrolase n=1 Tax=Actinomadura scrupuli TaxID=559629 RepID=UPI003D98419B